MIDKNTLIGNDEYSEAVLNSFIDKDKYRSNENYAAKLIANDVENTMRKQLGIELSICSSYTFAVAFITDGALISLKAMLVDNDIHGRILTSTYQNFNTPKAFRELLKLPNVEVRVYKPTGREGFHAKGYLFKHSNYDVAIIGSSNFTESALSQNKEWNLRVSSKENSQLTKDIEKQIDEQWDAADVLTPEWIDNYEKTYKPLFKDSKSANVSYNLVAEEDRNYSTIKPNKMQESALEKLQNVRLNCENKALVISATGTGKTYLGAFDVKNYRPKRFLFIVHREQILEKSRESFYNVIGGSKKDYGIWSGNKKEKDAKYLFATIQTISKDENLHGFDPCEFDYILVDEAHRAGSSTYKKVLDYFKPNFLLGMTATPERNDDNNIYELFDYNVAYEIRLQDALEEEMLSPFHYVGVQDYEYNGEIIDEQTPLARLVSEDRVKYVLKQSDYYGYSGDRLYGLVFVSRTDEAEKVAELMTKEGHPAQALTGKDSQEERLAAINRLKNGELEYIVTVDIFNEGIDIPFINQVVMMRKTQSAIIFIQQLGRGLRKNPGKNYVVVIDFIGNYKNNYLIPVALTGDNTRNKEHIRDTTSKVDTVSGISSINFTRVAKEMIFASLKRGGNIFMKEIKDDYIELKHRLGRIPLMTDFLENNMVDSQALLDTLKPKGNYNDFLKKVKEDQFKINEYEKKVLNFMSNELSNGMRKHELLLLRQLRYNRQITDTEFHSTLEKENCYIDNDVLISVDRVLSLEFYLPKNQKDPNKENQKDRYGGRNLVFHVNGIYRMDKQLREHLDNNKDFDKLFMDVVKAGLLRSEKYDSTSPLTIGERYSREEVCRLLNWELKISGQNIGGYFISDSTHDTCPIYITYDKADDISETIKYEDRFYNPNTMHCYSKDGRQLKKKEMKKMFAGVNEGKPKLKYYLFVKKSDDEGISYVFLGECFVIKNSMKQESRLIDGKEKPIVSYDVRLKEPVDLTLYYSFVGTKRN